MDKCPRCGLPPESTEECQYCGLVLQEAPASPGPGNLSKKPSGGLFQRVSGKQIGIILLAAVIFIGFLYQLEKLGAERKRQKLIIIAQKEKEKEQERLQQIELQKQEYERQQQEKARKEAEREQRRLERERQKALELQKAMADVAKFKPVILQALKSQHLDLVQDIYIDRGFPDQIVFKMKPIWHLRNKHLRKNDVMNFWTAWATVHNPSEPRKTSIRVVSINGDEVGGCKFLGGVWVEE